MSQKTCLIVDDASFICEIYFYIFAELKDFSVVGVAQDGQSAIQMLGELKPDLLILDLVIPAKNGFEVLSELNGVSPKTKTIVVSSLEDEAIKTKASSLGAIDYVKKPFTKDELLNSVKMVLYDYEEVQNG